MMIEVLLKDVISNLDNAREPAPALQAQGYGLCESVPGVNKPTLFQLALGSVDEMKNYCSLIDAHEPGIAKLSRSLAKRGQLQACRVRSLPNGKYALTFGARRALGVLYAHAISNGKHPAVIDATVSKADENEALLESFAENHFRANPSPIDEAKSYSRMMKTYGWSLREVAEHCELGESGYQVVRNRLELLKLSEEDQAKVHAGRITQKAALQKIAPGKSSKSSVRKKRVEVEQIDPAGSTKEDVKDELDAEGACDDAQVDPNEPSELTGEVEQIVESDLRSSASSLESAISPPTRIAMLAEFKLDPSKLPKKYRKKVVAEFVIWLLES